MRTQTTDHTEATIITRTHQDPQETTAMVQDGDSTNNHMVIDQDRKREIDTNRPEEENITTKTIEGTITNPPDDRNMTDETDQWKEDETTTNREVGHNRKKDHDNVDTHQQEITDMEIAAETTQATPDNGTTNDQEKRIADIVILSTTHQDNARIDQKRSEDPQFLTSGKEKTRSATT